MQVGVSAILLAAGASSRMGSPKALLCWQGTPFVVCVARALQAGGAAPLVVVTRPALETGVREALNDAASSLGPWCLALNPSPARGMLSSLWCGLGALPTDPAATGFLVALVDQPRLTPSAVRVLLDAHAAHPDRILLPASAGLRGHPVLFPQACAAELLATPLEGGPRAVVRRDPARVLEVSVTGEGAFDDFDTPEDLEGLHAHPASHPCAEQQDSYP